MPKDISVRCECGDRVRMSRAQAQELVNRHYAEKHGLKISKDISPALLRNKLIEESGALTALGVRIAVQLRFEPQLPVPSDAG